MRTEARASVRTLISDPVGRGACARPPAAVCKAAEAGAIPARDSISSGIGVDRHTRWPSAKTFQTGVEGALPSCPSIFATRTPVPVRASQIWLRRFNSAFAARLGCELRQRLPGTWFVGSSVFQNLFFRFLFGRVRGRKGNHEKRFEYLQKLPSDIAHWLTLAVLQFVCDDRR